MPSARSSPTEPVGTTGTSSWSDSPSLRRMMGPFPNSFSTPAMASSRALLRFLSSMGRRLLLSSILRTRSARKILFGGSVIVFPSAMAACDRAAPSPEPEPPHPRPAPRMEGELEQMKLEAGIETADDPAPPSGDLKGDIESFTTLDACVRARTAMDPLLGDAIEALGYDALPRDACRILQAMKARNAEACRPIVASGLRARCESYVAIEVGKPNLCPVNGSGKFAARDAVCLARASRDERMCAAASAGERA